jgi:hypothetical protein
MMCDKYIGKNTGPQCVNSCSRLKEKLSVKDPGAALELRTLVTQLCCTVSEGFCRKVVTNVIVVTLNMCTRNSSQYICASVSVVCNIFLQYVVSQWNLSGSTFMCCPVWWVKKLILREGSV